MSTPWVASILVALPCASLALGWAARADGLAGGSCDSDLFDMTTQLTALGLELGRQLADTHHRRRRPRVSGKALLAQTRSVMIRSSVGLGLEAGLVDEFGSGKR
jgi:hypothetical protein